MKRFIAILLAVTFLLTGCGGNCNCDGTIAERVEAIEAENAILRAEIERLENDLEEYKNNNEESTIPTESIEETEATYPTEFAEMEETVAQENDSVERNSAEVTEEMVAFLNQQADSTNFNDWLDVASCDYATEEILLKVAEKVAAIRLDSAYTATNSERKDWAIKISKKIVENKNTTARVLEKLAEVKASSYNDLYEVLEIVAEASQNDETSLLKVAEKVAAIRLDSAYTATNSERKDWAIEISKKIVENKNTTARVLEKLVEVKASSYNDLYEVLEIVAEASQNDETSLQKVAEKVATIRLDSACTQTNSKRKDWAIKISKKIVENKKTTARVLEKLAEVKASSYNDLYEVLEIVAEASQNDETSLLKVAEKVAAIKLNSACTQTNSKRKDWAIKITQKIVKNTAFSSEVAVALAKSDISEVCGIAHDALESLIA